MTLERRRVVTWSDPAPGAAAMVGLSGLEAVRAAVSGDIPPAPFAALVGITYAAVEPGRVRLAMAPAEFHYNPLGSVHGGVIATLLEAAMTSAVRSTLPVGRFCTTVEIKVSYARAVTEAVGEVWGEGHVVHAGRQVALAEGRVVDASGRVYATASTTCLVLDPPPAPAETAAERWRVVEWGDPRAAVRAAVGRSGLDVLQGLVEGAPPPPVVALLGIDIVAVEHGRVEMTLPAAEYLYSAFGGVHGGMTAVLLDSVMGCAVHSTLPPGRGYTTLEIKLTFVRPITVSSGVITGIGQVVHEGRRLGVAEARAVDAAGRLCATASTTCLVFDARPAGSGQ
jgi:uncharacterized protein (TIGR00369 family)